MMNSNSNLRAELIKNGTIKPDKPKYKWAIEKSKKSKLDAIESRKQELKFKSLNLRRI